MSSESSLSSPTASAIRRNTQLENARVAIARATGCVGITSCNGVVLAADKTRPSPLYDMSSIRHVELIDEHIGMVYSGLDPDFRVLVNAARKHGQVHRLQYFAKISVIEMVEYMAKILADHTNLCGVRPFGVSLLICGFSRECQCPQLYKIDTSGVYSAWKACALGKNADYCTKLLEERYENVMDTEDALYYALFTLWKGGCEMLPDNIDVGISDKNGFRFLDQDTLKESMYCFAS